MRRRVVALPVSLAAAADHKLLPVPFRQRLDPLQIADRPQRAPLPVARLLPRIALWAHPVSVPRLAHLRKEVFHVLRPAAKFIAVRVDEHRDAVVRTSLRRQLLVLGRTTVVRRNRHPVLLRRLHGNREVPRHRPRPRAGDTHGVEPHLLVLAGNGFQLRIHRHRIELLQARRPEGVVVRRLRRHRDLIRTHPRAALEEDALLPAMVLGNPLAILRDDVCLEAHETRFLRLHDEAVFRQRQRQAPLLHKPVIAAPLPVDEVGIRRQRLLHALEREREHHLLARLEEDLPARRRPPDHRLIPVHRARKSRAGEHRRHQRRRDERPHPVSAVFKFHRHLLLCVCLMLIG